MNLENAPTLRSLAPAIERVFELAGPKILALDKSWDTSHGAPVFTINGKYTTRGWTEWTQGFQFGMALLQFDATRDRRFLKIGRDRTIQYMAPHISATGVHDHGFNNISTYGNLRRLMLEGAIPHNRDELNIYELALKISGAVQASRWTPIPSDPDRHPDRRDSGFIHSFNGPHSLFADTIRSVRSLMLAHQLGHVLKGENDQPINLLHRGVQHGLTTAQYNVFYGEVHDAYDVAAGRVAHESIFNTTDGRYRCPSTQQGYSPFSTWTRGLAWILLGFAEQLEFLSGLPSKSFGHLPSRKTLGEFLMAATATAEWYIKHSFADGMVYWDAGAPRIPASNDYRSNSDPFNDHEPIDASAAAIAAQGFLRLSNYLAKSDRKRSFRYGQAARLIASTLFSEPYLSTSPRHQGLILHSIYHRPNGWDHIPKGRKIPCGESSMWGDYHALELAVLLRRQVRRDPYITFFDA